jgi:polysaccharide export outer membrane protein
MKTQHAFGLGVAVVAAMALAAPPTRAAQARSQSATVPAPQAPLIVPAVPDTEPPIQVPADYVIGAEDVLSLHFRYHEDVSGDVVVRPDGKIALPIVGDVVAAGLTVQGLTARITAAAAPFLKDATVSVQPKQINSRKVYITGEINKQGAFPLLGPMNVLQLISLAGGVSVYAKQKDILIIRTDENGQQVSLSFNYEDVKRGRNLEQNIFLRPGDQIVVP